MNLDQKKQVVEKFSANFQDATAIYFVDYKGCDCESLAKLRRELKPIGSGFSVIKNSLVKRSLDSTLVTNLEEVFSGPTAVIWSKEDPVSPAKVIAKFAKDNETFKVKAGLVEGNVVASKDVESLAAMPSKEELLSKLLALLNAPATQLLRTINAPASNFVQLLEAWRAKREGDN